MRPDAVRFDAADLVEQIEGLSQYQLDTLPFGVILLDRDGTVLFYSRTEAQASGYGKIPLGENLFAISPCMRSNDFQGRIKRHGRGAGRLGIRLGRGFRRSDARLAAARALLVGRQGYLDFHRARRSGPSLSRRRNGRNIFVGPRARLVNVPIAP
jgi:photoactive yellow protein